MENSVSKVRKGFKLCLDSRTNRIVHIDHVEEGYEHGICPKCKYPLVASNWNKSHRKINTYFRHKKDSSCAGETLIHLWAKQVIFDKKRVLGADHKVTGYAKDLARKWHAAELKQSAEMLLFAKIESEKKLVRGARSIIPDLTCEADRQPLVAIEIFVSNAVSPDKASFFEDNDIDCLEIDASSVPLIYLDDPDLFEKYIIFDAPRVWIRCSRYQQLNSKAQLEALNKAEIASEIVKLRRDTKREAKEAWRDSHSDFVALVGAYLNQDNQNAVSEKFKRDLGIHGTLSNKHKLWCDSVYSGIPEIINIPVKGELGFKCHRSVWQWEIYQRVVIISYLKGRRELKFKQKMRGFSRGYDKPAEPLAWYDHTPTFTPLELYVEITKAAPLNKICIVAEDIFGEPLVAEKDKPTAFLGLKTKEWDALPKPVCVIRRYIKELVNRSVIEVLSGDMYIVTQAPEPPLVLNFPRPNIPS